MASFKEQVSSWARETDDRLLAVFRRSIELLAEEMARTVDNGGRLPHVTGNLMRSLLARIGMPVTVADGSTRFAGSDVGLVVARALLEDDVFIGYQAAYAKRINYGFIGEDSLGRNYEQSGRHFLERAIALWPSLVQKASAEIEKGAKG